jgi:hypothetical protein
MGKYPALLCLISVLSCASQAQAPGAVQLSQTQPNSTLKLADGTPVKLRMTKTLSPTDARVGEAIQLEVVQEVCVGNSIVIFLGTTAAAVITRVNAKRVKGAPRQPTISIDSLNLADGTKALLRGSLDLHGQKTQIEDARSKQLTFTLSWPPYPVVSDVGTIILKNTEVTAYVDGDMALDEKRFPAREKNTDNAAPVGPVPA